MKYLPCKCHAVKMNGEVWSRLKQFSRKGFKGIQTKSGVWKKLNCVITKSGYVQTNLHGRIIRVNRLIASNFIHNPFSFPEVHHRNGNKKDNRIENLEWGNAKMNAMDREKHGHTAKGNKNPNAKLSPKKVILIRKWRKNGETLLTIANKLKVSKKLILLVIQRKIWKHVTTDMEI